MTKKYENKLDAMHLEQFETLTDEELVAIQGGRSNWYNIGYGIGRTIGGFFKNIVLA